MKLNENFFKHNMDGQTLLVPTAEAPFHGLIQGNKSVEVILDCLSRGADEEGILAAMKERFDGDDSAMREDIADVISKLRSVGAIDE